MVPSRRMSIFGANRPFEHVRGPKKSTMQGEICSESVDEDKYTAAFQMAAYRQSHVTTLH